MNYHYIVRLMNYYCTSYELPLYCTSYELLLYVLWTTIILHVLWTTIVRLMNYHYIVRLMNYYCMSYELPLYCTSYELLLYVLWTPIILYVLRLKPNVPARDRVRPLWGRAVQRETRSRGSWDVVAPRPRSTWGQSASWTPQCSGPSWVHPRTMSLQVGFKNCAIPQIIQKCELICNIARRYICSRNLHWCHILCITCLHCTPFNGTFVIQSVKRISLLFYFVTAMTISSNLMTHSGSNTRVFLILLGAPLVLLVHTLLYQVLYIVFTLSFTFNNCTVICVILSLLGQNKWILIPPLRGHSSVTWRSGVEGGCQLSRKKALRRCMVRRY